MQSYIVVRGGASLDDLMERVNAKMEQGYVPTGGLVIGNSGKWFQAMIYVGKPE